MARLIHKMFEFSGTHQSVTNVNSRAYGSHTRSPRGTFKPAIVNEAFIKSQGLMKIANAGGQIIKSALDPYRGNDGTFWTRLIANFRAQLRELGRIEFSRLIDFEVIKNRPLHGIVNFAFDVAHDVEANTLNISLKPSAPPAFRAKSKVDSCRYTIVAIFINPEDVNTEFREVSAEKSSMDRIAVSLPMSDAEDIVICVKCQGFDGQKASGDSKNTGMRIVTVFKPVDAMAGVQGD